MATTTLPLVARWIAAASLIGFVALFGLMWLPVFVAGNEGWLFLFPIFLLLWIPLELLAIASVVLVMTVLGRKGALTASQAATLAMGLLVALLSLPILWFGAFVTV